MSDQERDEQIQALNKAVLEIGELLLKLAAIVEKQPGAGMETRHLFTNVNAVSDAIRGLK